jgi:hypothetical protein
LEISAARTPFTKKDVERLPLMNATGGVSTKIITGVARRCEWGFPQVILCAAEKNGKPFPTTFWLLCPHLLRVAASCESQNGVASMEESLAGREEEWRSYHMLHARIRLAGMSGPRKKFLRRNVPRQYGSLRKCGVGGVVSYYPVTVKCIHLQIASYIGLRFHPASDWLDSAVYSWECGDNRCGFALRENFLK